MVCVLHNVDGVSCCIPQDATVATITAPLAISVSQDPLGEQGILRYSSCDFYKPPVKGKYATPCGWQAWSGALSKNSVTTALVNMESQPQTITLTSDYLPPHRRQADVESDRKTKWLIKDAFTGAVYCRSCSLPAKVTVGPHDVAFWVLSPPA